jgi:oxygen-dependent protoporphyrinogen oxidase
LVDLVGSKAFSAGAKLRLLKEPFVRTKASDDESIASFFERRLGREIVDYAVDPFISGIFAGDPEKLSIEHAFPRVFEMERDYGSLLAGALFSRNGAKRPKGITRTISFKNGMQTLTDALAEKLGERVRRNSTVRSVAKGESGFEVAIAGGDAEFFDAVIISTPAWSAAELVGGPDDDLANLLSGIYYPPIAVVYTGFKKGDVKAAAQGFGFLVPKREQMSILGSLWTSSVFENRAPEDYHLFTTFVGGARDAELALLDEKEIVNIAIKDLDSVLGLTGPPEFVSVKKWERAIPQYNIGYRKVINAAADFDSAHRGIFFCSNFYRGISVGDCVKNSIATTKSVIDFLNE